MEESDSAQGHQTQGFAAALFVQSTETTWKLLTFNFYCILFNIQLYPSASAKGLETGLSFPPNSSLTSLCILVLLMASLLVHYCITWRHGMTWNINFQAKVLLMDFTWSPWSQHVSRGLAAEHHSIASKAEGRESGLCFSPNAKEVTEMENMKRQYNIIEYLRRNRGV